VDPALNKMTKDEISQIHSRHKRETMFISETGVKRREEFEVNQEDEDEEFAGPSLDLFQTEAAEV
jgi:hypothetical protein